MSKKLRVLMIGAHPDDCDISCGGTALKYIAAGHTVKFLSLCNGDRGHHEMSPEEIRVRRRGESLAVGKFAGLEYDVWEDSHDCMVEATIANRERLVRDIRKFAPDIIFCNRPNDYHADHRNAAILVQDASYMLIVPNFCPDTPALPSTPAILFFSDDFQNPPFVPDVAVDTTDVIDKQFEMMDLHVSQMYEWLPWTYHTLDTVPEGAAERLEWLHGTRVPREGTPLTLEQMNEPQQSEICEYRFARKTAKFRDALIKRYGIEKGSKIPFAEFYQLCEYGGEFREELIPF
ncbi:MAG: PIG-L family deacetylase [Oscillospiraceae bacterium]|nr:PIG-L family deacetylase [Oscillospiraceae bacterium]